MSSIRRIKKVLKSKETMEGAGVRLNRAFGYHQVPLFDPFLLLDDFHSGDPSDYIAGFPWHPHRGIETITYMLEGVVEHGDSMGNKGVIGSGDVQWMTAGSGIIHQEMPKGSPGGKNFGFQLWANLPASHKMMAPRYQEIKKQDIPEVTLENGVVIKVICGKINGISGPVRDIVTDPQYMDVSVPANTAFSHEIERGYNAFCYVIEGEGYFDPQKDPYSYSETGVNYFDFDRECKMKPGSVVLYDDGDEISVTTENSSVRFLMIWGKPLNEPVEWYGPIVMNTKDELRVAFEEFRNGTFIK